jgi:hypothetical protein
MRLISGLQGERNSKLTPCHWHRFFRTANRLANDGLARELRLLKATFAGRHWLHMRHFAALIPLLALARTSAVSVANRFVCPSAMNAKSPTTEEEHWVGCHYSGTKTQLLTRLPLKTKSCRLSYRIQARGLEPLTLRCSAK